MPPGAVYAALAGEPGPTWFVGPLLTAGFVLWFGRKSAAGCEAGLRRWYDRNQGKAAAAA